MNFFLVENVVFTVLGYPVSYVELTGTLFGLVSVYFASKANILTWVTGLVNEVFLFLLFFQVQLYADMFLQVFFFIATLYGWHNWNRKSVDNKISAVSFIYKIILTFAIVTGTLIAGLLFSHIHSYLPGYFPLQAAYPFTDSFVMIASIAATILLAQKKIENWYLWMLVDVVCVILYLKKNTLFLSLEYLIFLGMATYGWRQWKKELVYE